MSSALVKNVVHEIVQPQRHQHRWGPWHGDDTGLLIYAHCMIPHCEERLWKRGQ